MAPATPKAYDTTTPYFITALICEPESPLYLPNGDIRPQGLRTLGYGLITTSPPFPDIEESQQDLSSTNRHEMPPDAPTALWQSEEEEDKPSPSRTRSLDFNSQVATVLFPTLEDAIVQNEYRLTIPGAGL